MLKNQLFFFLKKGGSLSINDHFFFGDALLTVTNTSYSGILLSDMGNFDVLQKTLQL